MPSYYPIDMTPEEIAEFEREYNEWLDTQADIV